MIGKCEKCGEIVDYDGLERDFDGMVFCEHHHKQLKRIIKCFCSEDGEVVMRAKDQSNLS